MQRIRLVRVVIPVVCLWLAWSAPAPARQGGPPPGLHAPLDRMLDLYVRDGRVYYNAIKSERGRLDAYLASLNGPAARGVDQWPRNEQIAFWLNAYNAWVLKAVADRYPIRGSAAGYPSDSIRQIAGVFERTKRQVAGRSLTLDAIETSVLAGFGDPRLYLALGRGALGSGRLRSEAFTGQRLEEQLDAVAREFTTGGRLLLVEETQGVVSVSPILSWREAAFVEAYAGKADARYAERSPIERALLALIEPHVLPHEREFLQKNTFAVQFMPFDWRLNAM